MNRRKSREIAMKLLFEVAIKKEDYTEVVEDFKENTDVTNVDLSDVDMEYITRILKGIKDNQEQLDKHIEQYLINWKLYRLSKVDLSILRIATYEILFEEDIPDKVSVNEAIELAKKFSEEKSATFINGVLGSMIKPK